MKILPLVLVSFITPLSGWAATDALPTADYSHTLGGFQRPYRDYSKEFEEEKARRVEKAATEARNEAREKGIREGEQKKALEFAQRMIIALPGDTDKNIAGFTQLSEETVAALRREIEAEKAAEQKKK